MFAPGRDAAAVARAVACIDHFSMRRQLICCSKDPKGQEPPEEEEEESLKLNQDSKPAAAAAAWPNPNPLPIFTFGANEILSMQKEFIPLQYVLHQNYPNPFNPLTSINFTLPKKGLVNITIYDMMGRVVKTLVNSSQTAGYKSIKWNATNDRNEPVSAGLYLYTIQVGEFRQTKKMVLLK